MVLKIFTDGGSRGNPGPAAAGVYVTLDDGVLEEKIGKNLGTTTNNVAEYWGVILGLETADQLQKKYKIEKIELSLDSELVTKQLTGFYKIRDKNLQQLFFRVKELEGKLPPIFYNLIPREKNRLADSLVNKILDQNLKWTN